MKSTITRNSVIPESATDWFNPGRIVFTALDGSCQIVRWFG